MLPKRLKTVLEPIIGDDLHRLYVDFREGRPDAHLSLFALALGKSGWLDDAQLGEALAATELGIHLPSEDRELEIGEPSYDRLCWIEKGGQGEVVLAHDDVLGRNVAYKTMLPGVERQPLAVRRFINEALITAQLDHPCIVPVYSLRRGPGGELGYAMKMIRGRTLSKVIKEARAAWEAGEPPPDEIGLAARLDIFLDVCNAMQHAHGRGVIHRDLKPSNIMVGADHEVVVMDWGLAKVVGEFESWDPTATFDETSLSSGGTAAGSVIGTPQYMSPEQALGMIDLMEAPSDQFTLGLILFELVTLRPAFPGQLYSVHLERAKSGQKSEYAHIAGMALPRELAAIIDKATETVPVHRYPDVAAFAADVRRYLRDEEIAAAPDNRLQRAQRWVGRNRELVVLVALLLVVLFSFGGFLSTMGLVAWNESLRTAAEAREDRLSELVGEATHRAALIDGRLLRTEALVEGLAVAAGSALELEPPDVPTYLSHEFADPETAPPDLVGVGHYNAPVSFQHPVQKLAPGVVRGEVEEHMRRMVSLQPAMYRLLLRSYGDDSIARSPGEQRSVLMGKASPVIWAYVSTERGVHTKLPGKGGYPPEYDGRRRTWYTEGGQAYEPVWGATYVDSDGSQLLIPCSLAVRSSDGTLLGVAGIDLSVERMVDELLAPEIEADVDAYVIDGDGTIVVATTYRGKSALDRHQTPFPWAGQLGDRKALAGHVELEGATERKLLVWGDLGVMDWTYVIVGAAQDLL